MSHTLNSETVDDGYGILINEGTEDDILLIGWSDKYGRADVKAESVDVDNEVDGSLKMMDPLNDDDYESWLLTRIAMMNWCFYWWFSLEKLKNSVWFVWNLYC